MIYNEESFWAGVAIGHQLKGWAVVDENSSFNGKLSDIIVRSQTTDYIEVPGEGFSGINSVTVVGDANLVPENIKNGITILGVEGNYIPKSIKLMAGDGTITKNGEYTFYPYSGYDGLSRQKITVNVPVVEEVLDAKLQTKSITPKKNNQTIKPDDGYDGFNEVTVFGDNNLVDYNIRGGVTIFGVTGTYNKAELQSKTVVPGRTGQRITSDKDYHGLSEVYIAGDGNLISSNIREGVTIFGVKGSYSSGQVYQEKTVVPNSSKLTVTADDGYNALSKVIVSGDVNLVPENIASGKTIFGVTGTYTSPMRHIVVRSQPDEQTILPTSGYSGFSSITVESSSSTGDYADGFSAGVSSKEKEIAILQSQIESLIIERDEAYQAGYNAGYEVGVDSVAASYKDLDEVKY